MHQPVLICIQSKELHIDLKKAGIGFLLLVEDVKSEMRWKVANGKIVS